MSLLAAISFSLSNNLNIFFTLLLNFPNRLGKSSRTAKIFCMQIQNIFISVQQDIFQKKILEGNTYIDFWLMFCLR